MTGHNPHLIAIAIGPVQDFIAASRKTRDLWFGSTLLSRTARAAAEALREECKTLIFPDLTKAVPAAAETPIPNKLLAVLAADASPSDVSRKVRAAARDVLIAYIAQLPDGSTGPVRTKVDAKAPNLVNWKLVTAQVEHFLEFYAAWVRYDPDTEDGYKEGRERVERLLTGRKALRDFERAPDIWDGFYTRPPDPTNEGKKLVVGAAKSSLDPSRDTVFQKDGKPVSADNKLADDERRCLKIKGGEQLDGISLIKRHGDSKRFVSVSRVAIDPFIRRLDDELPNELGTLRDLAGELRQSDAVEWFPTELGSPIRHYNAFPYDCQLFYDPAQRDAELTKAEKEKAQKFYDTADKARRTLDIGELPIHLAVLAADGDKMGEAISKQTTPDEHLALSGRLATFAAEAGEIVVKHNGALIYSGGDDVLAFLPLDTALCCADDLRTRFRDIVNAGVPDEKAHVSLSVGIAVGHYSEHLQNLLDWARKAERAAKDNNRNSLAVAMHTRTAGAAGTTVTHSWKTEPVANRWQKWIAWHRRDAIPDGAAYELRDLAQKDFAEMDHALRTDRRFRDKQDTPRSLLELEVARILKRKQPRGAEQLSDEEIAKLLDQIDNTLDGLTKLVNELIIARHFAEVVTVARGDWKEDEQLCP